MEVNESQFRRRFCPEYNKNALKYDKNGNKQNSTLGFVGFSERKFQLIESTNISYCVI